MSDSIPTCPYCGSDDVTELVPKNGMFWMCNSDGFSWDESSRQIRRIRALERVTRWRLGSDPPEHDRHVVVSCVWSGGNTTYEIDWFSPKEGWTFDVVRWCEIAAYDPKREGTA